MKIIKYDGDEHNFSMWGWIEKHWNVQSEKVEMGKNHTIKEKSLKKRR